MNLTIRALVIVCNPTNRLWGRSGRILQIDTDTVVIDINHNVYRIPIADIQLSI